MSDALSLHLWLLYTESLRLPPQNRRQSHQPRPHAQPQQHHPHASSTPSLPVSPAPRPAAAANHPMHLPPKPPNTYSTSPSTTHTKSSRNHGSTPSHTPTSTPRLYRAPPLYSPATTSRTVVMEQHLRCPRCGVVMHRLTLSAPGQADLHQTQHQCATCATAWASAAEGFCAFPALMVRPGSSGSVERTVGGRRGGRVEGGRGLWGGGGWI
ncbi:uncharacterized protein BDZ99DRAFT_522800 [Mytilinidion resinicola]|uniref:Uncharacterized protein n=1 Tax=Mytilinidion resinicola TaxID=574789 RepID=A0A6A6YGL6_9PEZI|nr:uncharacterized protein BDZ99DRAFT_522800 [Mytilinidion resinicola]KAF2807175.1 hypothetical protein BDZ99DRAFT_522800 [Mytilinidion resinicola]